MGKQSYFKRNWKLIVNVITIILLLVLVYALRQQIIDTFNNLHKANLWLIALMVPIQLGNYHSQTKMYQELFGIVGNKLRYWPVWRIALELNFVNQVFPSGGVSGLSYFGIRLRDGEITGSKATLVQVMKLVLVFISFEVLLIAGLLFMAIGGRVNSLVVLAVSSISTLLVAGTLAFVAVIGSERRIHSTFSGITSILNGLVRLFRPGKPDMIDTRQAERAVHEFHYNYKLIAANYRSLKMALWWSFMANVTEVLSIYVVYAAFGSWVNVGAVILAYGVANFAGLISVMPGGIGIYEALMTGVMAAASIPAALSLPVVVTYRVINTVIQLPPGYVLYRRSLKKFGEPGRELASYKRGRRGK